MSYVLRLNALEQAALLGVLVDYTTHKDHTEEWVDGVNKVSVTLDDLLTLVSTAPLEQTP